MKLIPIYLFMALFLGFILIYTIRNEQYFIMKDHKKVCNGGEHCNISKD